MIDIKEEKLLDFFEWMNERHAIYLRKERGDDPPWTEDPIMQVYKFTNVYRELDRGTVWYRKNFREPFANHIELFFNTVVYRRHNLIATAETTGFIEKYDTPYYVKIMKERQANGIPVFTGAYMTCGGIVDPATKQVPHSKVDQIFGIAFSYLWEHRAELQPQHGDTLEQAFERLSFKCPGVGPFIAYEVVSDLRWTHYLKDATDIMTWANPGPGAMRGIKRLMGLEVNWRNMDKFKEDRVYEPTRSEQIDAMVGLLQISPDYLDTWMDPLEMRDIEHSLCEFDKYERTRTGEGRPRSKYNYNKQV